MPGRLGAGAASSPKRKADVKSPKVFRRQSLMFGSATPVNFSRKRSDEVWSKGSLQTQPPAVQGETMMQGTRNPAPIGRPPTNSCGVPAGGTGGATWSKMPSFSS